MRKTEITKKYTEDFTIRYEMPVSNMANVYVNGESYHVPQRHLADEDIESDMDNFCREISNHNPLSWLKIITKFRQDNPLFEDIPYGFIITSYYESNGTARYLVDYQNRPITHVGLVERIDWENALYEEWIERTIY